MPATSVLRDQAGRTCSRAIGATRRRPPRRCAPDGFFITGDIATMAEDGRVAIVGRAKDLIIAGGLNIYPKEIELAIDARAGRRRERGDRRAASGPRRGAWWRW